MRVAAGVEQALLSHQQRAVGWWLQRQVRHSSSRSKQARLTQKQALCWSQLHARTHTAAVQEPGSSHSHPWPSLWMEPPSRCCGAPAAAAATAPAVMGEQHAAGRQPSAAERAMRTRQQQLWFSPGGTQTLAGRSAPESCGPRCSPCPSWASWRGGPAQSCRARLRLLQDGMLQVCQGGRAAVSRWTNACDPARRMPHSAATRPRGNAAGWAAGGSP